MKITPRRVIKAIVPYGVVVSYRRVKPNLANIRSERELQKELNKTTRRLLSEAKRIKRTENPKVVVSLTSFGERLNKTAPITVASLLAQSVMPDKMILWLAENEKPPKILKSMTKLGLEINYCEDIKSYKKLIFTLEKFPNSVIITVDDDVMYPKNWLSKTLKAHAKTPDVILAHRARKIKLNSDKNPATYLDWPILKKNTKDSHLIVPTGIGGILYPPKSFSKDVMNKNLFEKLAPYADDLWFWSTSELKGTKRAVIEDGYVNIRDFELDNVGLSNTINNDERTGNDVQFSKILNHFPELKKKIGVKGNDLESGFPGSKKYWEDRYATGGNSGTGSYDNLAKFKSDFLNKFVREHGIKTVIEFGTGDGNQLLTAKYPNYIGFDVSETAVKICKKLFKGDKTKSFFLLKDLSTHKADLTLSLDVIYHLIEDDVFESHMHNLFDTANKFVIIYAFDGDRYRTAEHVKSRKFTQFIEQNIKDWKLVERVPNKYPYDPSNPNHTTWADFYIYKYNK